jgi:tetratricopeptide (TPR) repeat protein
MNSSVLHFQTDASRSIAPSMSRVEILAANAGPARHKSLECRLGELATGPSMTWIVSCDFHLGGPWAGVSDFFSPVVKEILTCRPDLARRHAVELIHMLPALRRTINPACGSLTETALPQERVRSYSGEWAFRLVHGLIDLLDSWKTAVSPAALWCIGCEDYDRAGAIGKYFFRELMRRRGQLLNIYLIATVAPELGEETRQWFGSAVKTDEIYLNVADEQIPAIPEAEGATRLAIDLEDEIYRDATVAEVHVSDLIRLWTLAKRDDKVLHWKCFAIDLCLRHGLYEDALRYTNGVFPLADKCAPDDQKLRLWLVNKTLNAYMGAQGQQKAIKFVEQVVLPILENPVSRGHIELFFSVAMIYARYSKPRDLVKGAEFLDRGLAALERIDMSPEDYHFSYVFNRNGIAMIHSFDRRFQEAIDLCHAGIQRLNQHLGSDKHHFQRSLLMYNIAQVCFATGRYAEALEHYTAVIKLDPHYSEYYNERGNILLRLGRFEEARADYLNAIELSPPYDEVHTNLGQCYRRIGKFDDAIASYTRALDLRSDLSLALAGRASAYEELGQREHAIEDYTAALELDPSQWESLANRGVLHYEAGNLAESLADFNRAIELAPDQSDLFANRSLVVHDLALHNESTSGADS